MSIYYLAKIKDKGVGIFASRFIGKDEHIFHVDLSNQPRYSRAQLDQIAALDPDLDGDRSDYVGLAKYAFDNSPSAYMNHSCEPNCYIKMKSITVKDVYTLRDIEKGEELTHDYTATAVDQFNGNGFWVLHCQCGSKYCRSEVTGDFLEMPETWQRKYYPFLAPSIKRKYRDKFRRLREQKDK